jgi:hypothetical protein
MTYFLDNKNRLYKLVMVTNEHTILENVADEWTIKIAHNYFTRTFKPS